jgi:hypothetical protein
MGWEVHKQLLCRRSSLRIQEEVVNMEMTYSPGIQMGIGRSLKRLSFGERRMKVFHGSQMVWRTKNMQDG